MLHKRLVSSMCPRIPTNEPDIEMFCKTSGPSSGCGNHAVNTVSTKTYTRHDVNPDVTTDVTTLQRFDLQLTGQEMGTIAWVKQGFKSIQCFLKREDGQISSKNAKFLCKVVVIIVRYEYFLLFYNIWFKRYRSRPPLLFSYIRTEWEMDRSKNFNRRSTGLRTLL
jgi:hypothetical protein